jgi:predicted alpha/beta-fold hydrolase
VVLLHGLEGSLHSPYATRLFHAIEACGWAACLMHFRGCSGTPNRLPRSYHSGDTADLAFLLRWLEKQAPRRTIGAVGFSMGGNVLLKYLGENPGTSGLRCATAVSVPFDLAAAAARLDQGFSRVYQAHLLHRLHRRMQVKLRRHSNLPFSRRDLARARTFHDYDDRITAPLHGFESAADYYAKASSARFIPYILEPTLVLHARDDPFLPSEAVPVAAQCGRGVVLEVPAHGGHLGFVTDPLPGLQRPWLENRIVSFLHQHFAHAADTRKP